MIVAGKLSIYHWKDYLIFTSIIEFYKKKKKKKKKNPVTSEDQGLPENVKKKQKQKQKSSTTIFQSGPTVE